MKLATNVPHIVGIGENVFKVRDQKSRSYVYKFVNAITAEAYIPTATTSEPRRHNDVHNEMY